MHKLEDNILLPDLDSLLKAFTLNNVVLFAGAGISMSAGFPNWQQFILKVIANLETRGYSGQLEKAKLLVASGDFLLAAELIKEVSGKGLSAFIDHDFSEKNKIGLIHREITRVPFAFAITTNFDFLLETAYGHKVHSFNWLNISDFFKYIKKGEFAILKLHGDAIIDDSHIIAKNDYSGIMKNYLINSILSSFFSQKTFLFLGYSFRDPDILKIMEDGKAIFGNNFGPHYIFLFDKEIDNAYLNFLKKNYNLNVVISKTGSEITDSYAGRTNSTISFLRHLSGLAASISFTKNETLTINSEDFNFSNLVKGRLFEVAKAVGGNKVFCFLIDYRIIPSLKNVYIYDNNKNSFYQDEFGTGFEEEDFDYYDIVRDFFYAFEKSAKYLYIPDSSEINRQSCDTDVVGLALDYNIRKLAKAKRSILLQQIYSDGQCIGVIGVESEIIDAYTSAHLDIIKGGARIIAAIFRKLELRSNNNLQIQLNKNVKYFTRVMNSSVELKSLNLNYLLYEIDYKNGRLIAHYDEDRTPSSSNEKFIYNFNDVCFASHILKNNSSVFIQKVQEEINKLIAENGVEVFSIPREGSIFGTPIKIGKYTAFILVAWSNYNNNKKNAKQTLSIFNGEAISRLGNLIANSNLFDDQFGRDNHFENAEKFINGINSEISKNGLMDGWLFKMRQPEKRETMIRLLLNALVGEECGLQRVRVYIFLEEINKFICIYSVGSQNSLLDNQIGQDDYGCLDIDEAKSRLNKKSNFKFIVSDALNEYCQFTINRYVTNPYSIHQHRSMFRKPDPNSEDLNKPDTRWIVCPIVRKSEINQNKLMGFISADNLVRNDGSNFLHEKIMSEKKDYFQRYAIDSVVNLMNPVIGLIVQEKAESFIELLRKNK